MHRLQRPINAGEEARGLCSSATVKLVKFSQWTPQKGDDHGLMGGGRGRNVG